MRYGVNSEIAAAAQALRDGLLVVMPTETVYGLAANALNREAVQRVFQAKGRPADNPLIVHVADASAAREVSLSWPNEAQLLADRFWPGPLTLVLPKQPTVPDEVTAGMPTVAVRVPAHPVAKALIQAAGVPVAAPSANRFTQLSPTRAEDVDPLIAAAAFAVLDGGPCEVGIESTIVDLSGGRPKLLRPGAVSRAELEALIGVLQDPQTQDRAPGLYPRHYAPKTPLRLAFELTEKDAGLTLDSPKNPQQIQLPSEPAGYACALYAALQALDRLGLPELVVQLPPRGAEWEAVHNRLGKAAFKMGHEMS
jgi:L-threonylcarbamoyladenylate synthase